MRSVCTLLLAFAVLVIVGQPQALALPQFKKAFEDRYGKDRDEFMAEIKKAGCNVCHVKGEKDKEIRNAYGENLAKLLEGKIKDRIKEDKDAVMKEFEAAMDKVECEKEGDITYADLFKEGKLPSPDKPKE